jgi:hypothetical protein
MIFSENVSYITLDRNGNFSSWTRDDQRGLGILKSLNCNEVQAILAKVLVFLYN